MEPVSEEVRHHGSAVRPVQAEPSGLQARETQHLRATRREGGATQVRVVTETTRQILPLISHSVSQ